MPPYIPLNEWIYRPLETYSQYASEPIDISIFIREELSCLINSEETTDAEIINFLDTHSQSGYSKVESNDSCAICLDTCTTPVNTNCCKNFFCKKCLEEWLSTSNSCPMCRKTPFQVLFDLRGRSDIIISAIKLNRSDNLLLRLLDMRPNLITGDKFGMSAFMHAIYEKRSEKVLLRMLDHKIRLSAIDNCGQSTLMYVFMSGTSENVVMKMLDVVSDHDLEIRNFDDVTPTMLAFSESLSKKIQLRILDYKVNINQQDKTFNQTPLMFAFLKGSSEQVLLKMLKMRPKLNLQDIYGVTPVMHALDCCDSEAVLLRILELNPDLHIKNNDGYNAAMIAFEKPCSFKVRAEILKRLLKKKFKEVIGYNDFDFSQYENANEFLSLCP